MSTRVHTFYYPWYRSMATDGNWIHWEDATHTPPDDVAAAFYPLLGPYSANDPDAIHGHMKWLVDAGVGVIASSWWGQGSREDNSAGQLLDIADVYGVKVCFHMEPYGTRTASSVVNDVVYIINKYGSRPAFFRDSGMGNRPVFYFFASGGTSDSEWASAWDSIRGTAYDSVAIGDTFDHARVLNGHWDGFYNYFPGIDTTTWDSHASWATSNGKIFVPPVGPGWDSTQVGGYGPPTIDRERGEYYDNCWSYAVNAAQSHAGLRYVGITSFNEWHEGTQIEAAVPKTIPARTYSDYVPDTPTHYLEKTASWAAVLDPAASGKIQCEDYSGGASASEGTDYHDSSPGNSGGQYRTQDVDIQGCAEGGYNVGWISAGEWLRYTNVQVVQTGEQEIKVRAAAWNGTKSISVCDGSLGNVLLTLDIPQTGAFQNWRTVSGFVYMTAGTHTIYLYAESGDFNLNWFEIRPNIYRPDAPSDPGVTDVTANSMRWTWQDNSNNETGFRVYANPGVGPPQVLRATTAADVTYWDYASLYGNTLYSFRAAATNDNGASARTVTVRKYTLAAPPTTPGNIDCDKSVGVAYPAGSTFGFYNPTGFGVGYHGGTHYRVTSFSYAWDQSTTHVWTDTEPTWNTGTLYEAPDSGDGSYYLHLRSWNAEQVPNPTTLDYGPFIYDGTPPFSEASVAGGVYSSSISVALTANEDATIYYTTDGSEPTTASSAYSTPIDISTDTTLRFFAMDTAGNEESPKKQEVYIILSENGSIGAARKLGDGAPVALGDKVLYLKQGGFGYIEEPDRHGGIRVEGVLPEEGSLVSLTGLMSTTSGGERRIVIGVITSSGTASVDPLGANGAALGSGLMEGLYVKAWGIVKPGSVTGNSYEVTDGSDAAGITVITQGAPGVVEGTFVTVAGAAGTDGSRVIYAR